MNGSHGLLAPDMPSTQAERQALHGTHETVSHAQLLSAALDPLSAECQATDCQMPEFDESGECNSPEHALAWCLALLQHIHQ